MAGRPGISAAHRPWRGAPKPVVPQRLHEPLPTRPDPTRAGKVAAMILYLSARSMDAGSCLPSMVSGPLTGMVARGWEPDLEPLPRRARSPPTFRPFRAQPGPSPTEAGRSVATPARLQLPHRPACRVELGWSTAAHAVQADPSFGLLHLPGQFVFAEAAWVWITAL